MKKLLTRLQMAMLCIVLIGFVNNMKAQDSIMKSNGEEVKAQVMELTDTHIKYKKYERLNGPLYNISKTEVFMVIYEDGTKEVYSISENPSPAPKTVLEPSINNYRDSEPVLESNKTEQYNSVSSSSSSSSSSSKKPQEDKTVSLTTPAKSGPALSTMFQYTYNPYIQSGVRVALDDFIVHLGYGNVGLGEYYKIELGTAGRLWNDLLYYSEFGYTGGTLAFSEREIHKFSQDFGLMYDFGVVLSLGVQLWNFSEFTGWSLGIGYDF